MNKKEKHKIRDWGRSLITRVDKHCGYLQGRLFKLHAENVENPETLRILEHKGLLEDLRLFVEIRS